jgi:hypothetical protein
MKRLGVAAAAVAIALLTFLQFPGHTYLQQDSQIYLPILEHLRDPANLRNEILVQHSHVAYTLYDEAALALHRVTGLGFREVLTFQQIVTRALGIWGLFLIAQALGLGTAPALLVAMIVSLGALVAGPQVLTVEYEPTPRAFAVPLLFCAIGLAAHRRYVGAAISASVAFLYHVPAALPFWVLFGAILILRRIYRPLVPLGIAVIILAIAAQAQGWGAGIFVHLTPLEERLQHLRTGYVWISTWPFSRIVHHLLAAAIAAGAYLRIRHKISLELHVLLPGLAILGLVSMPASWLLLEHWKLSLAPQVQPMRTLLFVTFAMQLLTAVAGAAAVLRRRRWEAAIWFFIAYLPPLQSVFTEPYTWKRTAVAMMLAVATAFAGRFSPAVALAAFFLMPTLGGVVNYPQLRTAELGELAGWARSYTPRDAVFLFADAGRALEPGVFRSESLRAVYVDWKGGGQVNYLREFAEQWWLRWEQTIARGFKPEDLARYDALGIQYIVLQPKNRLPQAPVFENSHYLVYRTLGRL